MPKRPANRGSKKSRKAQKTREDDSPDEEEYEVEQILGRRNNNGTGLHLYPINFVFEVLIGF